MSHSLTIQAKDISIIIRYIMFLFVYIKNFDENVTIDHVIMELEDNDELYEHIDHIIQNYDILNKYISQVINSAPTISDNIDHIMKNNSIHNLGMVKHIILLILVEQKQNINDIHLIMNDYFKICNIFNIPNKLINLSNKIIKLYIQKYNI